MATEWSAIVNATLKTYVAEQAKRVNRANRGWAIVRGSILERRARASKVRIRVNNTLNLQGRVRKDLMALYARAMKAGYAPWDDMAQFTCPRCASYRVVDLTHAPVWFDAIEADPPGITNRNVYQCAQCHLIMVEDWFPEFTAGGEVVSPRFATLHLIQPEEK